MLVLVSNVVAESGSFTFTSTFACSQHNQFDINVAMVGTSGVLTTTVGLPRSSTGTVDMTVHVKKGACTNPDETTIAVHIPSSSVVETVTNSFTVSSTGSYCLVVSCTDHPNCPDFVFSAHGAFTCGIAPNPFELPFTVSAVAPPPCSISLDKGSYSLGELVTITYSDAPVGSVLNFCPPGAAICPGVWAVSGSNTRTYLLLPTDPVGAWTARLHDTSCDESDIATVSAVAPPAPPAPAPAPPAPAPAPPSAIDEIKEKIAKSACIILRILQGISGIVGVLMIVLAGLKWMSSDDPQSRSEARTRIAYVLIGFFVILLSLELVNVLAGGLGVLGNVTCTDKLGDELDTIAIIILKAVVVVCRIIKVLRYVFAVIGAILIIFAGFRWMTSDDPEARRSSRNIIVGVVIGILFITIAPDMILQLFGDMLEAAFSTELWAALGTEGLTIDDAFNCETILGICHVGSDICEPTDLDAFIDRVRRVICIIFRVLQGVASVVAALVIMTSGIIWFTSDDAEKKSGAKGMIVSAVVGLILVVISLELVNSLIMAVNLGTFNWTCSDVGGGPVEAPPFTANIRNAICVIVKTVEAIIGMIVALIVVYSAVQFAASEDSKSRAEAKSRAVYAVAGLIVCLLAMQLIGAILTGMGVTDLFHSCGAGAVVCTHAYSWQCAGAPGCYWDGAPSTYDHCKASGIPGSCGTLHGSQANCVLYAECCDWNDPLCDDDPTFIGCTSTWDEATCGAHSPCCTREYSPRGLCRQAGASGLGELVNSAICVLLKTLQLAALVIAAIILVLAGIEWMSSEDPGGRADARSMAVGVIIAVIVVVVATELVDEIVGAIVGVVPGLSIGDIDCDSITGLTDEITDPLCIILRTLQGIVAIIAAILLVLVGLQWMMAEDPKIRTSAKAMAGRIVVGFIVAAIALQLVNALISGFSLSFTCSLGWGVSDQIRSLICIVLRMLEGIAGLVAALILLFSAIQFMSSDSSASRSQAKSMAVHAIAGLVIVIIAVQLIGAMAGAISSIHSVDCGTGASSEASTIGGIICVIFKVIQVAALIVAALVFASAGLMWLSTDSPEGRSRAKSLMLGAVVGLVIVVVATQLISSVITSTRVTDITCGNSIPPGIEANIQHVGCVLYQTLRLVGILGAIVVMLIAGLIWASSDSAEGRSMAKRMILHAIVGLGILLLAIELITALIGVPTNPLSFDISGCTIDDLSEDIRLMGCMVIKIVEYSAVVLAILALILAGLVYMAADSLEARRKIKVVIGAIVISLLVVVVAVHLINAVISQVGITAIDCSDVDIDEDVRRDVEAIGCSLIRMIQLVCGVVATILLILAGLRWMTSDNPEERNNARSWIIVIAVGLIIVMAGMLFVTALVTGFGITDITCST